MRYAYCYRRFVRPSGPLDEFIRTRTMTRVLCLFFPTSDPRCTRTRVPVHDPDWRPPHMSRCFDNRQSSTAASGCSRSKQTWREETESASEVAEQQDPSQMAATQLLANVSGRQTGILAWDPVRLLGSFHPRRGPRRFRVLTSPSSLSSRSGSLHTRRQALFTAARCLVSLPVIAGATTRTAMTTRYYSHVLGRAHRHSASWLLCVPGGIPASLLVRVHNTRPPFARLQTTAARVCKCWSNPIMLPPRY